MRSVHRLFGFAAVLALVSCGGSGGSGDDDDDTPDAAVVLLDAPPPKPAELTGLGQKCGMGLPECPTNAPQCAGFTANAAVGICTAVCVESSSFMTDAMGMPGPFDPAPETGNGVCTAAFSGTIGTAGCGVPFNLMPNDNPIKPNTTYTVLFACGIACEPDNSCPGGLTCNAQKLCVP
ncbi:MAG: hypothetical protein AB7O24_02320 [Kofleriaceae bacterium]